MVILKCGIKNNLVDGKMFLIQEKTFYIQYFVRDDWKSTEGKSYNWRL